MNMTEKENKILEKMHTLRAFDYARYSQLITAMDLMMDSEIERCILKATGKNKIIRFPGMDTPL